ncbi:hypothetical protein EBR96_07530, partial [bacterium]|nr:hypothetical protein [bacterium]
IIGNGPSAIKTALRYAEAAADADQLLRIHVIGKSLLPGGRIRSAVAPDHHSVKDTGRRDVDAALANPMIRYWGGVSLSADQIRTLSENVSLVVAATGAVTRKYANFDGHESIIYGSKMVAWYNSSPNKKSDTHRPCPIDLARSSHLVINGQGNVVPDIIRVLLQKPENDALKSRIHPTVATALRESGLKIIEAFGRQMPHKTRISHEELVQLNKLAIAGDFKIVAVLNADQSAELEKAIQSETLDPEQVKNARWFLSYATPAFSAAEWRRGRVVVFRFEQEFESIQPLGATRHTVRLKAATSKPKDLDGSESEIKEEHDTISIETDGVIACIGYTPTSKIKGIRYLSSGQLGFDFRDDEGPLANTEIVGQARTGRGTYGESVADVGELLKRRPIEGLPKLADIEPVIASWAPDAVSASDAAGLLGLGDQLATSNSGIIQQRDELRRMAAVTRRMGPVSAPASLPKPASRKQIVLGYDASSGNIVRYQLTGSVNLRDSILRAGNSIGGDCGSGSCKKCGVVEIEDIFNPSDTLSDPTIKLAC